MSATFNFSLPFFEGFYESIYENSDTEYYAIREEIEYYDEEMNEKHEPEDFEFDYIQRRQDIIEAFCNAFYEITPSWVTEVKFESLDSPKYYNFSTDRIFADVTFDDDWREQLLDFIKENYEELKKRIKEDWSSRSGFISFMEDSVEYWVAEIKKDEPDDRYITALIQYYLEQKHEWNDFRVRECLHYLTMDEIYDRNYISLKKEEEPEE